MAEPGSVVLNVSVNGKFYCNVNFGNYLDFVHGDSATMDERIAERAEVIARGIKTQFPNDSISFSLSRYELLFGKVIPFGLGGK